jgi:hypothetical protein
MPGHKKRAEKKVQEPFKFQYPIRATDLQKNLSGGGCNNP